MGDTPTSPFTNVQWDGESILESVEDEIKEEEDIRLVSLPQRGSAINASRRCSQLSQKRLSSHSYQGTSNISNHRPSLPSRRISRASHHRIASSGNFVDWISRSIESSASTITPDLRDFYSELIKNTDAGISESDRDVLRRQLEIPDVKVTYWTLYRYASTKDLLIVSVSILGAILSGTCFPLMTLVFGQLTGAFIAFFSESAGPDRISIFDSRIDHLAIFFVYLAIARFIGSYVATVGFMYTGEHITQRIREQYLAAILRQNVAFFDTLGPGEITTRITSDMMLIQRGISQKLSLTIDALATFVAAFTIGFVKSWLLTLTLSSIVVAMAIVIGAGSHWILKYNQQAIIADGISASIAEESVSSIRNATAFHTQDKLAARFGVHVKEAKVWEVHHKRILGIMIASMMGILYLSYGLSFWEGSRLLVAGKIEVGSIFTITQSMMLAAFSLSNVAPNIETFSTAVAAARKILIAIDRLSPIDPSSTSGERLSPLQGSIELRNIKFVYPSRPDVVVLKNLNLVIPAGKTTALAGASGSGKSTIIGLLERFYNPLRGTVLLDGVDIENLNLRWLRTQMSLVGQEPSLFSVSIRENIRHGLVGTQLEHTDIHVQNKMIVNAARQANAHDFIMSLPEGYDTNVGKKGFLLSGGQKQRIAIARAIVSDPKILLLDEATSALDATSEKLVQEALEKASVGRTTIVIAHKLATIRNADNIVLMSKGEIVEQGTHAELLLRPDGAYRSLYVAQKLTKHEKQEDEDPGMKEIGYGDRKDFSLTYNDSADSEVQGKQQDPEIERRPISFAASDDNQLGSKFSPKDERYSLWTCIKFLASLNAPDWKIITIGIIITVICGSGNSVQAVFYAKIIVALSGKVTESQISEGVQFWCLMFLMLGIVEFFAFLFQSLLLDLPSERMILRVREWAFRSVLRQDIAFFDKEENSPGALTSFLISETKNIAGLSGATLGTFLISITMLIEALAIAVVFAWKFGLVCAATTPILVGCGFFSFRILCTFQSASRDSHRQTASYACEAASEIRTIASLVREKDVWEDYHQALDVQRRKSLFSTLKFSVLFAASQSFSLLCIALAFWYGGNKISSGDYGLFQFYVAFISVIWGAESAGNVFSFADDMGAAKEAAQELKVLFDRTPQIDSWSKDGTRMDKMDGRIDIQNVYFRYPTRPKKPVLLGLNLSVKSGQYVALVGHSGCGKSTVLQLLERFYDPVAGSIFVDGRDISTLNVKDYRSHLALVSQEPTLYHASIRGNILLGAGKDVTDEDLIQACKNANIYDFILSLPDGFSTMVGSKGGMLSGGQKQRIAIARALLRNPRILLLDEATSALDSESEKVVQEALDTAAKGRTTIAVAHRLSTIQKADMICVFDEGQIVEQGSHIELLKMRSKYWDMVNLQNMEQAK